MQVSNNGVDFRPSSQAPSFLFAPTHTILEVRPARVDLHGPPASVAVIGRGFPASAAPPLECLFGAGRVPAVSTLRLSPTELRCVVPPLPPGNYTVSVMAGAEESSGPLPVLHVLDASLLLSVSPSSGPARGGTVLVLSGARLATCPYTCRFGSRAVPAARVSATLLRCITPALHPGATSLTLACSSSGPVPGPALSFVALSSPPPRPATIASLIPRSGPRGGGTYVSLRGEGLATAEKCGFGDVVVPAVYDLVGDVLVCHAPPALAGANPALLRSV